MIKPFFLHIFLFSVFSGAVTGGNIDYALLPEAKKFVERMHARYGFDRSRLFGMLHAVRHQYGTLARYRGRRGAGSTDYSWERYRKKILIGESVALGVEFMSKYRKWLDKASKKYGVSPEIITAFIRVESKFGLYGKEYPVWDSLVTLAFNPNRKQDFFRSELEYLLLLGRKNGLDILKLRGSFAGAMGCVQQVPSIQLRYGVDLDGDGREDPDSMADCIGSIAAFLGRNGWDEGRVAIMKAVYRGKRFRALKTGCCSRYSLALLRRMGVFPSGRWGRKSAYLIRLRGEKKDILYLGDGNYRIVTRYNASARYAATVLLYASALKKAGNR